MVRLCWPACLARCRDACLECSCVSPTVANVVLRCIVPAGQVKKLQCEVPLDTRSRNYNTNVEPSK